VSGSSIFWRVPRSLSCSAIVSSSHVIDGFAYDAVMRAARGMGRAVGPTWVAVWLAMACSSAARRCLDKFCH